MSTSHQHIRAARDNLIDLMMGFGLTYPLTDLDIRDDQLKVPHETSAKIPIVNSQNGVIYKLQDRNGVDLAQGSYEVAGNGGEALLPTPLIEADTTFKIWARKTHHLDKNTTHLGEMAEVKVGLDISLAAMIKEAELLQPGADNPLAQAPRIIHYGKAVEIVVENSQEGVDYWPVYLNENAEEISLLPEGSEPVRGDLGDIILRTSPVYEDIDIRIRVIKTFDASIIGEEESELLLINLPLKVRANADLVVSVQPDSIADFFGSVKVDLSATQAKVNYRLYRHTLVDHPRLDAEESEYLLNVEGETGVSDDYVLTVDVPGNPNDPKQLSIRKPSGGGSVWLATPDGYQVVADYQQGNGNQLSMALDALKEDTLIIVEAQKVHQIESGTVSSSVQLNQAGVILVKPDPVVPLTLRIPIVQSSATEQIWVLNGQPGVFYYFRMTAQGEELRPPVYFHKRTTDQMPDNVGLDKLRLEVDFAVASNNAIDNPIFEIDTLPNDSEFYVRAQKAITGVSTTLSHPIPLPTVPTLQPLAEITAGSSAQIIITDSHPEVNYQVMFDKQLIGDVYSGNGGELTLLTPALTTETVFTLRSIHQLAGGLTVEYEQRIAVKVNDDA